MKRQLLVMRHAKSDRAGESGDDFARPLAKRGLKDAPRIGQWLLANDLLPDHLLASPAVRARETALAVAGALGLPAESVHFDERLYLAGCERLLEVVAEAPAKARRLLLVGHNPGLDELVEYLAEDPPARSTGGKLMTTAALACFETDESWRRLSPGGARLLQLLRPRDL